MGSVDGIGISTNHLAYKLKVEMKMRESIKEEGGSRKKGEKNERNKIAFQNQTCNRTCE